VIGSLALATGLIAATRTSLTTLRVEVLRTDEQGLAVGARTAVYRVAMLLGSLSITLAGRST